MLGVGGKPAAGHLKAKLGHMCWKTANNLR